MATSESRPRENIVLVGFMGSGKSSIGRRVAKELGFQFIDTDQIITDRYGLAISDIFAKHGEPHFRNMETGVIESLSHLNRCVIATGGGAVIREANRQLLRDLGFVVGLTASEDVIFDRVSRNDKRPLLQTENPRETLQRLLDSRRAYYQEAAQFTLDTSELTQPEVVAKVIAQARDAFLWNRTA